MRHKRCVYSTTVTVQYKPEGYYLGLYNTARRHKTCSGIKMLRGCDALGEDNFCLTGSKTFISPH